MVIRARNLGIVGITRRFGELIPAISIFAMDTRRQLP